jgi:hypothetical protein
MTDRDARAYSALHASDYPALQLDELGRLVRSPAIEKLVTAARRVTEAWRKVGASDDSSGLFRALAEVDTEAGALVLGSEEKAQPRQNKELPPNVDHGLETPKPGGEPGSDVVSELLAPDPSVTSESEK